MKKAILYIHGKGGSGAEAEHYRRLCPGYDVIGLEYQGNTPWETKKEFIDRYEKLSEDYPSITIIANSIGAFFAMNALNGMQIERALFISPIVDMEKLISDMMRQANVTEEELREKQEIETGSGEFLSWRYLCYVRENPIVWETPTYILYGENDNMTSYETVSQFAGKTNASMTVMENGEHWFHTAEQMAFLDDWITKLL